MYLSRLLTWMTLALPLLAPAVLPGCCTATPEKPTLVRSMAPVEPMKDVSQPARAEVPPGPYGDTSARSEDSVMSIEGVVGSLAYDSDDSLPFGGDMTRPEKLSGPDPEYTKEALAAGIEGTMVIKCVITKEGKATKCRIIRPLPHMEQAVLQSLYRSRYTPVTLRGRPVAVDYTFYIRLSLPRSLQEGAE